jgi:putative zinc finger/helix-turn-helix YgiT family protein
MQREKDEVCPLCGEGKLAEVKGDFAAQVDSPGGHPIKLIVSGLSWRHCDSCNEDLLDEQASAAITASHRAALKLLTADEIRLIRQKLGKTQGQMSELLGIGEKTYCRWESGTHFQSEAFDRYLRALQASPGLVDVLNHIRRQKESTPPPSASKFKYLESPSAYESTNEQFTLLLRVGCFHLQSV